MTRWGYAQVVGWPGVREVVWTGPDGVPAVVGSTTFIGHLTAVGQQGWEVVVVNEIRRWWTVARTTAILRRAVG